MKAKIVKTDNSLTIEVNGKRVETAAYMTYLEENARYADFQTAGYDLFCACVYMGDGSINENSGVHTFGEHVWKSRENYDFTPVYNSIKKIVGEGAKKAYVMLRVNLNAPRWWRAENPNELVVLSDGVKGQYMQSAFSEKWKADAKIFLKKLCEYIKTFEFSENVIAIQVAGMQTEEWLALRNATGSFDYSLPAQKAYQKYIEKKYKNAFKAYMPTSFELAARHGDKVIDEGKYRNLLDYEQFFNEGFARTIQELCAYVKELTNEDMLVGVFYGYFGQLPCEYGHSGVSLLLHDKNIDFFASPFAYIDGRKTAKDWIYHGVMDSCARANKLWFMEADIRTHKTLPLYETNPELMEGERTVNYFKNPVFMGLPTEKETLWVLLRTFGKVLAAGYAFWWFDMWGGWYDTPAVMQFMTHANELYRNYNGKTKKENELAVIMDEKASYGISEEYYDELSRLQLVELGFVGVSYDMYHSCDEEWAKTHYKTLLYIAPTKYGVKGNLLLSNSEKIEKNGLFSAAEIAAILRKADTHVFSEGNIVYANSRFVCLTAAKQGKVQLSMPTACKIRAFTDGKEYEGTEFVFDMEENQTELFEIEEYFR